MTDATTLITQAFERPQWYLSKTAYNIKIRTETIAEFTQGFTPEHVLDLGCGDGSLSLPLLPIVKTITLVDRSKSMLELAASHIPAGESRRVTLLNSDLMEANLPPQRFDLILCVGVLAYIEDRRSLIGKIISLLKPGGAVIMECTDGKHPITHLIRAYKSLRTKAGGTEFPTVIRGSSELLALLEEHGFELCGAFRYSLPLPGIRRLLSQELSYQAIRTIYGTPARNRAAWLGNECLYSLRRKTS